MELSNKLHSLNSLLEINGYEFTFSISEVSVSGEIHDKNFNIYSFWFSIKLLRLYDDKFLFGDAIESNMHIFKTLDDLIKHLTKKIYDITGLSSFTFI